MRAAGYAGSGYSVQQYDRVLEKLDGVSAHGFSPRLGHTNGKMAGRFTKNWDSLIAIRVTMKFKQLMYNKIFEISKARVAEWQTRGT
jgi:hypothetical protein